VFNLLKQICRN